LNYQHLIGLHQLALYMCTLELIQKCVLNILIPLIQAPAQTN